LKRILVRLAILAVLVLLVISNPKTEDFLSYVEDSTPGGDRMKDFFLDLGQETKTLALKEGVERKSYFFFSVFKVSDEKGEKNYKVLGFARSIFVPLTRKQETKDIGIY